MSEGKRAHADEFRHWDLPPDIKIKVIFEGKISSFV